MNYSSESRQLFLKGIDENKYIPAEYKGELKEIIASQFLIMGQVIGTFELLVHRQEAHYNGLDEKLNTEKHNSP